MVEKCEVSMAGSEGGCSGGGEHMGNVDGSARWRKS